MITGNTNLPQFTAGVKLSTKDLSAAYAKNAGEVGRFFIRAIADLSPVDTGRYLGSHQTTIGRRARGKPISVARAIARDPIAAADVVIRKWEIELARTDLSTGRQRSLFFTNLVPYAERIENGWSPQAPAGVYRVALPRAALKARTL
jgi:hypothetical protein